MCSFLPSYLRVWLADLVARFSVKRVGKVGLSDLIRSIHNRFEN